ncbi:MAG: hypothetical protein K2L37_04900 [Lactobacillus sp.]|nr:hypothetical protein [Lactobacillus sp.]
MKTSIIISIVFFILLFLFAGHVSISFKPFSISLPYWHRAVGITLVVIGVNIGEHKSGYKKGLDDGVELTIKYAKEKINNNEYTLYI